MSVTPNNQREILCELAECFAPYAPLYAVGGCVRDALLGVKCYDIDVCSQLEVDDVKKILSNTDFVISNKSLRMGTVHIFRDDFCCEYTTFRQDSYDVKSGAHSPTSVKFTDDMLLDARRRDFCCNAIYFDIKKGEIVDVLGGADDVKNKLLRTADNAQNVFEADGLRILRLVRFYAELGFEIESETLVVAKRNAWRVKDIAVERVREELSKIFVADTKHPELNQKDGHIRGFRLLDELGLVDMLMPELANLKGLEQPKKYHKYDAYEHCVKAFEVSPPTLRWASLLHDVGKAKAVEMWGNMHGHEIVGVDVARGLLNRLKFSNAQKSDILQLVRWHMIDINGNMSMSKLRRFVAEHLPVVHDLCVLMDADAMASSGAKRENRLALAMQELLVEGTPLKIADLNVSGQDLIALGVEAKYRGEVLKTLLVDTVMNPSFKERERALRHANAIYHNLKREKREVPKENGKSAREKRKNKC